MFIFQTRPCRAEIILRGWPEYRGSGFSSSLLVARCMVATGKPRSAPPVLSPPPDRWLSALTSGSSSRLRQSPRVEHRLASPDRPLWCTCLRSKSISLCVPCNPFPAALPTSFLHQRADRGKAFVSRRVIALNGHDVRRGFPGIRLHLPFSSLSRPVAAPVQRQNRAGSAASRRQSLYPVAYTDFWRISLRNAFVDFQSLFDSRAGSTAADSG